jgi:deoxycytidylate deaminase
MATATAIRLDKQAKTSASGRTVIAKSQSTELFFAVVGPVGAGGSRAIESLERVCQSAGFSCERIKASELIREWAVSAEIPLPASDDKTLEYVTTLQDLGDEMRRSDPTEVAKAIIREIAKRRAKNTGQPYVEGKPVKPDDVRRAYLIDSIRHPSEIQLLRRTYGISFALIGVVCEETQRQKRVMNKYFRAPLHSKPDTKQRVESFIKRDSDDPKKRYGQHVADCFFEADFFVDNTLDDLPDTNKYLDDDLSRLVSIIVHDMIVRPTIDETAMHHAYSARVRSACLSRQVGAALVDRGGTIVSTGTNEVPAAGGGVYGESFLHKHQIEIDNRCAFRESRYCSNNKQQNEIINELINSIEALAQVPDRNRLVETIRKTRLGGLVEFSRAVHAEMDAILSAGRDGISTVGTRLFVTTFPCHYCARHIVSAGIYEVQFIEPYPKSLAFELHKDSIELNESDWTPPSGDGKSIAAPNAEGKKVSAGKVLFRPFVGVAPRMYNRAFEKTWELKDKVTGDYVLNPPAWGSEWSTLTVGYPEIEASLAT